MNVIKARSLLELTRWTALASLSVTLGACATALPPPQPVLGRLAIASITIVPATLEGADASEREWFQGLLAGHATATAGRMTIEAQLAERVVPNGGSHQAHLLSGSVSTPIALPSEYRGSHAAFQKGPLAVAQLELRGPQGTPVSVVQATVSWKDVQWTAGSAKSRRARRPDGVLIDAAQLAVERAVKRLLAGLRGQQITVSRYEESADRTDGKQP